MSLPSEAEVLEFPRDMVDNARHAANVLKALGHEHRLLIMCLLADGEKAVTRLEELLSLKQPAVSQLLTRLRADDLVTTRRDGKTIYYSIADPAIRDIIQTLYKVYCQPSGVCVDR
ncbi:MAG: metalloregulator ArsR/SmtB family transcription factor [Alphaproteobacteria bacterium]|nr:metalloregulator ArsR/SmtB family transcription factor [Alphaproteobacteria bacterium]